MHIKVLDVPEKVARKVEAVFKKEAIVRENEDLLYDISFTCECTMSTINYPDAEVIIYNEDNSKIIWFFDTDFSEVKIL